MEFVILVDENDQEIGLMEKQEAHEKGLLHRAFSIFIFNSQNELLLQQRASSKYHSPGLWTNTCCSHPRKNESVLDASIRRLNEEMGFQTDLTIKGHLLYKADLVNGLIENEFDYLLVGFSDAQPSINLDEVCAYKYESIAKISEDIKANPELFTEWFKLIVPKLHEYLN